MSPSSTIEQLPAASTSVQGPPEEVLAISAERDRLGRRHNNREPAVLATDRDPWERQRGESKPAYSAFSYYLQMGLDPSKSDERRSIRKAAEALGRHHSLFGAWSVRWRWVDRSELYDMAMDKLRRDQLERKALELQARKLDVATKMVTKVGASVEAMEDDLKPFEAARLAEAGVRLSDNLAVGGGASVGSFEALVSELAKRAKERAQVTD